MPGRAERGASLGVRCRTDSKEKPTAWKQHSRSPDPTRAAGTPGRRRARPHPPLRRRRDRRGRPPRRLALDPARPADGRDGPVGLRQVDADAHPRRPRPSRAPAPSRSTGSELTTLKDNDLTKLRRRHIGFVFQFFNLLPMLTAEENVMLPLSIAGKKPERGLARGAARRDRARGPPPTPARPSSPAASSSGSRSRGRSSRGRRCCSPTSPPATSTRRPPPRSSACCAAPSTPTARRP